MVSTLTFCRVEVYIRPDEDASLLMRLKDFAHQIEEELGYKLVWQPLDGKKSSRVKFEIKFSDLNPTGFQNTQRYVLGDLEDSIIDWFALVAPKFFNVVSPFLKKL